MYPTVVFEVAAQDSKMISRIAEEATYPAGIFEVKSMHSVVDGLVYFHIRTSYEPMELQALIDSTEVAEGLSCAKPLVKSLRNVKAKNGWVLAEGTQFPSNWTAENESAKREWERINSRDYR